MIFSGNATFTAKNQRAIVTMAIGNDYLQRWKRLCQPLWESYASRWDYDLIVITKPLDRSERAEKRNPSWQKCLILDQPWSNQYETIVWVDSDILIRPDSPEIAESVPAESMGACVVGAQLSWPERQIFLERIFNTPTTSETLEATWNRLHNVQYEINGIQTKETRILQCGVLVLSPRHHQAVLQETYAMEDRVGNYEQVLLSRLILEQNKFFELNPRFNWNFFEAVSLHAFWDNAEVLPEELFSHMVRVQYRNAYFLHFAGKGQWMDFIGTQSLSSEEA